MHGGKGHVQRVGDLRVAHAHQCSKQKHLTLVERQDIQPGDVFRQRRPGGAARPRPPRAGNLDGTRIMDRHHGRFAQSMNPDERREAPGREVRSADHALRPHRQHDRLLDQIIGGLGRMSAHQSASKPPQMRDEAANVISEARHGTSSLR